ncbi:hypothetical protein OEZ86_002787 [Tetradesmus obliquus]|nr:hypothetical protein OEZ86_002787 [Tetradesmus obliquus]
MHSRTNFLQTSVRAQQPHFRPFTAVKTCRQRCSTTAAAARRDQGQEQQPWIQVGLGLAAAATAVAVGLGAAALPAQAVTSEQLLFLEAWRAVDRAYVDKSFNGQSWFKLRETYLKKEPMDRRAQTYDAIRKLLAVLDDPFTRFLEPSRLAALRRGTAGSVTGVGLEITYDGGSGKDVVVLTPAPGGPAEKAGARAGDVIVTVDGTAVKGLSLYDVSDLLQGEADSQVEVVLQAPGAPSNTRTLQLTRQKVTINPVTSTTCSNVAAAALPPGAAKQQLGYVRLATFNSNTTAAAQQAFTELSKQGVAGLVLDIRNNGGGLFPAGVNVARMLVDRGDLVLIADSQGIRDIYSADGNSIDSATPLVVLVNRGTASASEVLAGALKDSKRGLIAGERTFGKGLIQTVVDLSDGSGVAVTVARYQTPAGVDINKIGVSPDVQLDPEVLPTDLEGVCRVLGSDAAPRLFG